VVECNACQLTMAESALAEARDRVRAELGIPADAAIVGVFGNHILRKRTHVLADVLRAITHAGDGRPVYGLACGGRAEPYDHELDGKIAAFSLGHRLLRPGFVRPVENWMAACDVILAPAIHEPLARNVLEAQALEVPVVVSTDGGLRELIRDGENGLLCDPYDLPDWIAATRRLLDDSIFARALSNAGRATVAELTPERHAARIAGIYHGLPSSVGEAA